MLAAKLEVSATSDCGDLVPYAVEKHPLKAKAKKQNPLCFLKHPKP